MTMMNSAWQGENSRNGLSRSGPRSALRRHWRVATAMIVVLAGLGAGAAYLLQPKPAAETKPAVAAAPTAALTVTVAPVQHGIVPRSLMVTGSLAARDELPIGTETSELAISEVLVDVGDHVKKGDLLARFDNSVLKAQQQQMVASLNEAEANAAEAVANAKRADELVKNGWISGKDYDNRRALAQSMEARVGVARANLAFADAKLKQADIRAPADGTITQRSAHLGAVVSGGELFRMIREDRVELIAELPENDLALVKPGQTITLNVDGAANHDTTATGVVRLIEPTVDVKTRIGRVRIDVTKGNGILPGMFVNGLITLGQTEALVVPEKAVVYHGADATVMVVDANGKIESRSVKLGPHDHDHVAVLSGVSNGERVAMLGANYLKSGDQVTIVDTPAEAASNPATRAF